MHPACSHTVCEDPAPANFGAFSAKKPFYCIVIGLFGKPETKLYKVCIELAVFVSGNSKPRQDPAIGCGTVAVMKQRDVPTCAKRFQEV